MVGRWSLVTRRKLLGGLGAALAGSTVGSGARAEVPANWSAIADAWQVPEWYRDAKFGIWAHWGPQCVPEHGDWYGRQMYQQGNPFYDHHLRTYGHPADTGFIDIIGRWKGEKWDPAYLARRYRKAGARYIMAMASHHDNLDLFDSSHHDWNSVRVGPKKDIVGIWEKIVRAEGLRFGVSNHSSHAWHWWQTGYGYDPEGPRAGERFDAFRLTAADGKGRWWDGLDPQQLYGGPAMVPPAGIRSIPAMNDFHETHSGRWMEFIPDAHPHFVARWLMRQKQLVEKYRPDLIYFDDYGMPFDSVGVEALAHYYGQGLNRDGKVDVVATAKRLSPELRRTMVDDVERGFVEDIRPLPWQTCTCIGDWHYNRWRYEAKAYVPAREVVQRLCDIVSKNGNLLLSIPVRGDGSIDSEEEKVLDDLTRWMARNGDAAIFGSRPWRRFGEGPTRPGGGMHSEGNVKFAAGDVRYMVNRGALYAAVLVWPEGPLTLTALGKRALPDAVIERVSLVGGGTVRTEQTDAGLTLTLPRAKAGEMIPVLRIEGRGIA